MWRRTEACRKRTHRVKNKPDPPSCGEERKYEADGRFPVGGGVQPRRRTHRQGRGFSQCGESPCH